MKRHYWDCSHRWHLVLDSYWKNQASSLQTLTWFNLLKNLYVILQTVVAGVVLVCVCVCGREHLVQTGAYVINSFLFSARRNYSNSARWQLLPSRFLCFETFRHSLISNTESNRSRASGVGPVVRLGFDKDCEHPKKFIPLRWAWYIPAVKCSPARWSSTNYIPNTINSFIIRPSPWGVGCCHWFPSYFTEQHLLWSGLQCWTRRLWTGNAIAHVLYTDRYLVVFLRTRDIRYELSVGTQMHLSRWATVEDL